MKQDPLPNKQAVAGAALMAVLFIIAVMAAAVAAIYSVTTTEGRLMRRSVDRERAISYGDGVVQNLFDQWRVAMASTQEPSQHGSGFTYNELMSGTASSPAVTVPTTLPLKAPTALQLPVPEGISLASWNVTPANPYLSPVTGVYLNPTTGLTTRPIPESGTNSRSRIRTNYIASAKVNFPGGSVTVQRPFVRSGRNIFDNFLFSTQHVTEIHPGAAMYINGTVYAGGDLYTGTNNLNFQQEVTYTGSWQVAYLAGDPHASTPSSPNWPTNGAPHPGAQQKLLDTPLTELDPNFTDGTAANDTDSDSNLNNDGYHEILEELNGTGTDPLKTDSDGGSERMASNADYRIYVDASNNVTIFKGTSTTAMTSGTDYTAIMGAITTNTALADGREGGNTRVVNLDVGKIATAVNASASTYDTVGKNDGLLLYINDTSVGTSVTVPGYSGPTASPTSPSYTTTTTTNGNRNAVPVAGAPTATSASKRAVRLINGGTLPSIGLTVATPNPVYIQGDYNTGSTTNYSTATSSSYSPLTNSNLPASNGSGAYPSGTSAPAETSGTYTKAAAAIAADAVTILSNSWSDGNSTAGLASRVPTNTTINAAIVAGNVPTTSSAYSGGIENFPRLLETWNTASGSTGTFLTIHGSFGLLYDSEQATAVWKTTGNYYNAPSRRWFFDPILQDKNPPGFPVAYSYGMGAWALK